MRREGKLYENLHHHHGGLLVVVVVLMLVGAVVNSTSTSVSGGGGRAMEAAMMKEKEVMMMVRCRDNERKALLDFKKGLVDKYGILSSWGNRDCCQWRGIRCSNRTGHVIALHLPGGYEEATRVWVSLAGKVSPSLLKLKDLKYLNLSSNIFDESPIPEFIGSLTKLQHLDLAEASFVGKIPQQLGNLTNLRSLDLSFNVFLTVENLEWLSHLRLLRHLDLSGIELENSTDWLQQIHQLSFLNQLHLSDCRLPSPLLPLTNSSSSSIPLAIVDLSSNNFSSPSIFNWLFNSSSTLVQIYMKGTPLGGSIPEAFGSMLSLEYLDLSYCELEGELPKNFSSLKSLKILNLQANRLSGSPPDVTRIPSLRELHLGHNELNGSFPKRFSQISGLIILDFSNNKIPGSLPHLTLFPSLRELNLKSNQLQGTISEAYLSNLFKLKNLDLSFNSLSLEFNFDWDPPFQLEILQLAYCNLGPNFPKWLRSQRNLSTLDISVAKISDSVPNWFWDLTPRLHYLNISFNHIEGIIPDLSRKFVDNPLIDLSSNHFKGLIPLLPPNVSLLHISKNMFTGSVFSLCSSASEFLSSVDLSDNQLSGELPDCWMRSVQLLFLNLANNNFSGKIPNSIGFLGQLKVLQIRNNSFTGELPSSLKNCSRLRLLDLGENKVSGEIPTWIGTHLTSLIVLSLRKNEFFGRIPPQICYLSDTQVLDLSQNYMSGDIPHCFNNFTSLLQINSISPFIMTGFLSGTTFFDARYIENTLVQWKGKESDYRKTLGILKLIDLSRNKLVGKIPREFSSLEGLVSLNLSVNKLTGNIVENIGQMTVLESLDLSKNQLSGKIPIGLASLTFLSVLDLSNNNFSGKIPSSTQLQGFNASMYAGNDKLCGLPLLTKCPEDELNLHPPPVGHGEDENNEEDEDRFVKIGFYISVVLGFALGFWGFFGPILLRNAWRHAYFRLLDKTKHWIYVTITVNMARLQRKLGG